MTEAMLGEQATALVGAGRVFRTFPGHDSHCTSIGFDAGGVRWFVKGATDPRGRVSLRGAIGVAQAVEHPVLVPLRHVSDRPGAVVLVYPFVDGDPIRPEPGRTAQDRFRELQPEARRRAVDQIFDLHLRLADRGFVAVDLYDGCVIYDGEQDRTWVFDLDEYRPSSFVLDADRLPGSTRFMAPEERVRGSVIDQRTNVFTLGRLALVLLGDREGRHETFTGPAASLDVLRRATAPERGERFHGVRDLVEAWTASLR